VNDKETLPEQDLGPESSGRFAVEAMALVVVWSHDEPWRLGQSILVPPANPGRALTFGRGSADDPSRVSLQEQRPGGSVSTPPLAMGAISRQQLEIRPSGRDAVLVRNLGKCALLRNGALVTEAEYRAGDTLQLGKQLVFCVVRRPTLLWGGDVAYPEFAFGEADAFGIVGESAHAWRLRGEVALTARRPGHVLISGASGTGKELVARAIHALSPRSGQRLVARNAATLPESLIDAELFGNAKNYPNPGMAERPGLVGSADGSTLFLDEIAELPQASQAHLLRVLDDGEYHRLGESSVRRSDFRLIAATNRDPSTLKHDLFARLTFRIGIPPMSARPEDIPLLVRHIIRRAARAGDEVARAMLPGGDVAAEPVVKLGLMLELMKLPYALNVRELEATLWSRLAAREVRGPVDLDEDRPPANLQMRELDTPDVDAPDGSDCALDPTAARIQACLDENNGVLELTWRALGMKNRFTLLRAIKKYALVIRRRPGQGRLRRSTDGT
jgi:two-component system nitrogen regulation response regulator GlnG/two-component system response regulator HydG